MNKVAEREGEEDVLSFSQLTFEEILAAVMMLVIVVSVSWGVLTRYVFATPASWTSEAASIAFAWAVFVGAAAAFLRREHSSVDALLAICPRPIARILQTVADLVVLATLLAVAWLAIGMTLSTTDVPTTVLRIPQSVTYGAAAVGFTVMALRHLMAMTRRFRAGDAA
ncbi:TRAP transporter small permease [Chelatococcus sp. GCM10030263]|uniref:TRAP transporter small permease n=1 Tax=Chelatococcus sp. GCM10030263 TaxID=3273387 RepID=UPI00360F3BA6